MTLHSTFELLGTIYFASQLLPLLIAALIGLFIILPMTLVRDELEEWSNFDYWPVEVQADYIKGWIGFGVVMLILVCVLW